jgi:predicted ATPase
MLIKAITIENFKGISEPIRVELKPLTFLFGANSSGKSSVIQALHYVREVLEFRRLDVDKTMAGGDFIDLGGFDNIIHGHDTNLKLRFKIELNNINDSYFKDLSLIYHEDAEGEDFYNKLCDDGNKYVELTIVKKDGNIFVERINIFINNAISLTMIVDEDSFCAMGIAGNVPDRHHFNNVDEIIASRSVEGGQTFHFFSTNEKIIEGGDKSGVLNFLLYFLKQRTLLPDVSKYIQEPIRRDWDYDDYVSAAFETALFGMIGTIVDDMTNMMYVGPLRDIPPRNYLPQRFLHSSRWANGLAAWDTASYANQEKIDELNCWMGAEHLNTGYQLQSNYFYRIPVNTINSAKKIENIRAELPEQEGKVDLVQEPGGLKVSLYDVGVGISQVFPVIVAALDDSSKLTIIEQPELHIHPRLQVELGDLFIKAIQKDKCLIIETHSEHLLLRIMKRMRKYATSQENKCELTPEGNSEFLITPEDVGVWFLEPHNGRTIIREMALNKHGELVKSWPGGFFEEGLRETI